LETGQLPGLKQGARYLAGQLSVALYRRHGHPLASRRRWARVHATFRRADGSGPGATGMTSPIDKPHIVVVDDDPELCQGIEDYLGLHGFKVTTGDGGDALRRILAESRVDLVVLDLNMPGEDGLTLTRYLRQQSGIGVLILTGAADPVERVVGLEVGADDYLAKPFDPRELLARIRSVLRRLQAAPVEPAGRPAEAEQIRIGRYTLNLNSRLLIGTDAEELALTSMEFDLLRALAQHPNQVMTRDQLLNLAHNRDWEPFDRSIDVRITRLRRKIEADPLHPRIIRTIRGAGYMFVPDGDG
jgi:DNA-binding response OmpR family regulator